MSISGTWTYAGMAEGIAAYQRKDYALAYKEFFSAVQQGDELAQFALGVMYDNGQGVAQDYIIAHMWINISAANGYEPAIEFRKTIAGLMTQEQIAKAQDMARDWIAQHPRK